MIKYNSGSHLPESESGKIFITGWFLLILVVISYYSGALVSMIAIPQRDFELNNLERLWDRDMKYDWAWIEGSDIDGYFESAVDETYQEIAAKAEKLLPEQITDKDSEIFDRIRENWLVYIDNWGYLEGLEKIQYDDNGKCNFDFSREKIYYEHIALGFPMGSPWTHQFNKALAPLHQSGIIDAWKRVRTKIFKLLNAFYLLKT